MTLRAARCSLIKAWFISFGITGAAVVCVLLSEACRSPQADRRFSACGLSPPMMESVKFILKTSVCADSLWCENGLLLLFEQRRRIHWSPLHQLTGSPTFSETTLQVLYLKKRSEQLTRGLRWIFYGVTYSLFKNPGMTFTPVWGVASPLTRHSGRLRLKSFLVQNISNALIRRQEMKSLLVHRGAPPGQTSFVIRCLCCFTARPLLQRLFLLFFLMLYSMLTI